MGFIKFEGRKPPRFKDFEEAKPYIENMLIDKELTLEAVDYMITHKEYYFLLKNLVRQFAQVSMDKRELFDYIFSRLDKCPKRAEDVQLYKEILEGKNKALKQSFLEFAKRCAKEFKEIAFDFLENGNHIERFFAFCMLIHLPDKDVKEKLKEFIMSTENKNFIKEFIDYIYLCGSKEDINILENLKEKFPEFEKHIDYVERSLA